MKNNRFKRRICTQDVCIIYSVAGWSHFPLGCLSYLNTVNEMRQDVRRFHIVT